MKGNDGKNVINTLRGALLRLSEVETLKDIVIKGNRDVISSCSKAIDAARIGERGKAEEELLRAINGYESLRKRLAESELGEEHLFKLILEAEREVVEAYLFYLYVFGSAPPLDLSSLSPEGIVRGFLDFTGELRRLFLEKLIKDDLRGARESLELMKEVYSMISSSGIHLSTFGDLKRRLDILRSQIEKSLEDLNVAMRIPKREG